MYVEQLYTPCLSEAAYYIESNGEAAIIDPLRDTDKYVTLANTRNAKIKFVFETHFHADFVSGHIDLAHKCNAPIIYGPNAETGFKKYMAEDGEEFQLGNCTIKVIHTPGHTLESTCYLLLDEHKKPYCIFTGDTLFVGDVGRPDLFSGNLSKEILAGMMYHSLEKIKQLPDTIIVYPAHGPGSSCGKNLGSATYTTLGEQKRTNYALQSQTETEFVKAVTDGLNTPPAYFPINAKINKQGYTALDTVLKYALTPLSVQAVKQEIEQGTLLLDTRNATTFTEGFIPSSINIGLEGRFAEFAGMLLPFSEKIILITDEGKEEESAIRLTRVGFEKIIGYLQGGLNMWKQAGEELDLIINVEPDEVKMDLNYDTNMLILDVRKEIEHYNAHVKGALNIPLQSMNDIAMISNFEDNQNIYVHCAGGYRSVIASSILKKQGIHNIRNVVGGFKKMQEVPEMPIVTESSIVN